MAVIYIYNWFLFNLYFFINTSDPFKGVPSEYLFMLVLGMSASLESLLLVSSKLSVQFVGGRS